MAIRKDIRFRIIGDSPALKEMLEQAEVAAEFSPQMPILTVGEPGSGKELTARYIHDLSRPSGPFVAINCAALSPGLIESEFFGHVAEAFTGATKEKLGAFERANGGTLFLDEIHTLRLEHQSKLNRVLSEMEVRRVGGSRLRKLNFRLIVATNCDLYEMVQKGTFKGDLFDRLNVFVIEVPSLRERAEDILPIARHFLEKIAPQKRFSQDVEAFLANNICPGNVRVLKNLITAAAAQSRNSDIVTLTHIKRHLKWKLPGYEDFSGFRNPAPTIPTSIDRSNPLGEVHSGIQERVTTPRGDREPKRAESSVSVHEWCSQRRFCMTSAGMRMDIILKILENKSPSSVIDFRTATGASKATTERDLKKLVKMGAVHRLGKGRNTCYVSADATVHSEAPIPRNMSSGTQGISTVVETFHEAIRDQADDEAIRDHVPAPQSQPIGDRPDNDASCPETILNWFKDKKKQSVYASILHSAVVPRTIKELMAIVGRKNRSKFRNAYIRPLLEAGLLETTSPDNMRSSKQKYVVSRKGTEEMMKKGAVDG